MRQLAAALTCASALMATHAHAQSNARPVLADVALHASSNRSTPTASNLLAIKPTGNWVLLVLDANLSGSEEYLNSLKADGFDGDKLVVLVIGEAAHAQSWADRAVLPRKARLASGGFNSILGGLKLPGTPAFIGVTANGEIGWQRLGYGKKPGDRLVRIWDWVKRAVAGINNLGGSVR